MKQTVLKEKKETIEAFDSFIGEKYKGKLICIGDCILMNGPNRFNTVFWLTEKLLQQNKKVLIVSDELLFSDELLRNADLNLMKKHQKTHNLYMYNSYPVWLVDNKLYYDNFGYAICTHAFIQVNLKNPPFGCGNADAFLKQLKSMTVNMNVMLFTYLSNDFFQRIETHDSDTPSIPLLSEFPKATEYYADKIFSLTNTQGAVCGVNDGTTILTEIR